LIGEHQPYGKKEGKMSFQENLQRKIELDKLAARVIASIGTGPAPHHVDKEAMRSLLEQSQYQYRHERDLDLYVKPLEDELKMILVLDNELPIYRSTVDDVVIRKSPRTLEMWRISTIRHILVDTDIKVSTGKESVAKVLQDAVSSLDLHYTDRDIEDLARDGMAWLAGVNAEGVEKTLRMFAELLGYRTPPGYFGLDRTVSYGIAASGPDDEVIFGPLVLYRPEANALAWIDRTFSRTDTRQMEFLRAAAAGQAPAPVTGDAVFQKLQENVLLQHDRVLRS
jgi:hypothetical protein